MVDGTKSLKIKLLAPSHVAGKKSLYSFQLLSFLHKSKRLLLSLVISTSHFFLRARTQSLELKVHFTLAKMSRKRLFVPLNALDFAVGISTTFSRKNKPIALVRKGLAHWSRIIYKKTTVG